MIRIFDYAKVADWEDRLTALAEMAEPESAPERILPRLFEAAPADWIQLTDARASAARRALMTSIRRVWRSTFEISRRLIVRSLDADCKYAFRKYNFSGPRRWPGRYPLSRR